VGRAPGPVASKAEESRGDSVAAGGADDSMVSEAVTEFYANKSQDSAGSVKVFTDYSTSLLGSHQCKLVLCSTETVVVVVTLLRQHLITVITSHCDHSHRDLQLVCHRLQYSKLCDLCIEPLNSSHCGRSVPLQI